MEFILNTIRKVENDQAREFAFGDDASLKEKLAIVFLNPEDMKKLNVKSGSIVKIYHESGVVNVKCIEDKKVPFKMALMPVSIWSNQLTRVINNDLVYKNIEVKIEADDEPILDYKSILQKIKEEGS
ncbi:MAG: molybdopterin dinucleotide binding domain-containing protein [Promethearchaeota archaeon]